MVIPWVDPIVRPLPMSPANPVDPVLPIPDTDTNPGSQQNDPNSEECRKLAEKINNTKDEIYNKRYPDLENNPGNLPYRIGPGEKLKETVRGHEKLLNRRLRELRNLEDKYYKRCAPMACL